jgi:octanoyl-[GcvH]:protein N-octanoyltransferase
MDASQEVPVRLGDADDPLSGTAAGMHGRWQIVFVPALSPVEAGLARQQALADRLASASAAPWLLVWRSEPALLVSRTDARLPHFQDAVADLRRAGWPVVLRKSGGRACPVAPGTVQVSMIDPILPQTTINGRYAVLAELLQATLRRYRVFARVGLVAGAYCAGAYDLSVADRKIAGMSQHWFRNRCGVRCAVTAASINVEDAPEEVARAVNRFYRCAGGMLHCDAAALTNVQLCGATPSVGGPDFAAAVIDQPTPRP